jgi:hypothetical protein
VEPEEVMKWFERIFPEERILYYYGWYTVWILEKKMIATKMRQSAVVKLIRDEEEEGEHGKVD